MDGANDTAPPAAGPPVRRMPVALASWALIGLVLVLIVVLLIVKVTRGGTTQAVPPVGAAPADVADAVAHVPGDAFDAAGSGTAGGPQPAVLAGQPPLTAGGRVQVVFVGAQFCPYCAAEEWPLVVALSRFGTFRGLQVTTSSSQEVFPDLATFSLNGATYRSSLVTLSATERYGPSPSTRVPAGFPPIRALSRQQQGLLAAHAPGGPLPFLDVGNRLLAGGAAIGYSPGVLQGLSLQQIAASLTSPSSPAGGGILGAANAIAAAICAVDGSRPAPVCSSAGVQAARTALGL